MVYSGDLNEELKVYAQVETQSESGFKSIVEEYKFSCMAYRKKNKERYVSDEDAIYHFNELTFLIRYRNDIKETDIIVYEGERYRIKSLNPYKRENQITIIVQKLND